MTHCCRHWPGPGLRPWGCHLLPRSRQTLFFLYTFITCLFPTLSLSSAFCHWPVTLPLSPDHSPWHLLFLPIFSRLTGHPGRACSAGSPEADLRRARCRDFLGKVGGNTGGEVGRGTRKGGSQIHYCTTSPAAAEPCGGN